MEWKTLLSLQTQVTREAVPDDFKKYPISDLEKDYNAIVSSSAFRRLQDKTQVFPYCHVPACCTIWVIRPSAILEKSLKAVQSDCRKTA